MNTKRKYTDEQEATVVRLRKTGITYREISEATGIPIGSCEMIYQRHVNRNIKVERNRQGFPPKTR